MTDSKRGIESCRAKGSTILASELQTKRRIKYFVFARSLKLQLAAEKESPSMFLDTWRADMQEMMIPVFLKVSIYRPERSDLERI